VPISRIFSRVLAPALIAAAFTVAGCSKSSDTATTGPSAGGAKTMTVGFIYVGTKDDYGYNQSHALGAAAVKAMPGVTVIEDEGVKETKDCEQAMESMINLNNATLLFPTSYGYFDPHVLTVAAKYPAVTFIHAGGTTVPGKTPANVGSFFAYIDEVEYLCGMVSGLTTKSNKLGYVAAKPIPPVLRDINAFEAGAKSVNPAATLTVIFTGDWFMPTEEANAVTTLADQGIDVVSGHIDSPKVLIQTADKRGIYCCGYHADGSPLAPAHYLTGAEWNWGPLYTKFVADVQAGKPLPENVMGNLQDGTVKLGAYGPAVSAETKAKVDAVKAIMMTGAFHMFTGPLKDNKGEIKIPAGTSYGDQDGALWGMHYLIEGVIGNIGS
jgi:basic membrane protein A